MNIEKIHEIANKRIHAYRLYIEGRLPPKVSSSSCGMCKHIPKRGAWYDCSKCPFGVYTYGSTGIINNTCNLMPMPMQPRDLLFSGMPFKLLSKLDKELVTAHAEKLEKRFNEWAINNPINKLIDKPKRM